MCHPANTHCGLHTPLILLHSATPQTVRLSRCTPPPGRRHPLLQAFTKQLLGLPRLYRRLTAMQHHLRRYNPPVLFSFQLPRSLFHNTGWPQGLGFDCTVLTQRIRGSVLRAGQTTHTRAAQDSPPADQGILDAQGQGTMFGRCRWWGATLLSLVGDPALSGARQPLRVPSDLRPPPNVV